MNRRNPTLLPEAETPVSSPRAALYMRVSTGRQAEHDVSIPDQRTQLNAWCRANGFTVAAEFIEAGASAGDDRALYLSVPLRLEIQAFLDRRQQTNTVFSHPVFRSSVGNRVGNLRQAFPYRDAPPTLDRAGWPLVKCPF